MSFILARMLVTCIRKFIKGWVFLKLGDKGCDVYIKKVACGVSSTSTALNPCLLPSNGVIVA